MRFNFTNFISIYKNQKYFDSIGGDDRAANFWSSLICSFREAFFGGLSPDANLNLDQNTDIATNVNQESAINNEILANDIVSEESHQQLASKIKQREESKVSWKILSRIVTILKVGISVPGMFVGGLSLGSLSLFGEFAMDKLHDNLRHIWAKKDWMVLIQHQIDNLEQELLQALQKAKNVPKTIPKVDDPMVQNSFIYQNQLTLSQIQSELSTLRYESRMTDLQILSTLRERQENVKYNSKEVETVETSSELLAEIPTSRVAIAIEDPRYAVIAEKGITLMEKNTFISKSHNIRMNTLFLKSLFRLRGDSLHVFKGLIINKEGIDIEGLGDFLNNKYGDTKYTDKITEATREYDILEYLSYDFQTATDPIYVIPISKRYNPSIEVELTSKSTLESNILSIIYSEYLKSEKVSEFVSDYGLIFQEYPSLLDNIIVSKSIIELESFIDMFNSKVDSLLWELFKISDSSIIRGQIFSQITLNIMKNQFLNKWVIKNPTSSKELDWNTEVNNFWRDHCEKVLKSTQSEKIYKIFKNCFGLSVMHTIFVAAETNKMIDFDNIISGIINVLDGNSLDNEMARVFLLDSFTKASLGIFQIASNEYGKLIKSYSTFSEWKGYLAEVDELLNYLPVVVKEKFFSSEVSSLLKVITKYYYGSGRDKISSDPHILLSSNFRFPDLSIWKFELNDNEDFDIEFVLQASKYSMDNDYVSESFIDILSSLYIAVRENIQSGNPKLKLIAKASLLNLLNLNKDYNTFTTYFDFLLRNFADKIYSLDKNFYDFKTGDTWKVDRLIVAEEQFILKELNEYIWKKFDYSLTTNQYITELASLSNDASFILRIYNNIKNKNFGTVTIEKIGAFLKDLAKRSTSLVSTITTLSSDDNIVVIPSINRISNIKYYRITDKYASGQYGILRKVFDLDSSNNQYQNGFDIESSTEFKKAYKIIHTFDSNGNPIHGLAQISQNKLVPLPNGWFDGLIIKDKNDQNQLINNLVFTDHFGHLLSTPFFNPNTDKFMIRDISIINEEIRNNPLGAYGINILIDFSKMDSRGQMNSLITVDLIDNEFNIHSNYHLPSSIGNYFENLDTSKLVKMKSRSSSLKSNGDLCFLPIIQTSGILIKTGQFYEFYYNIISFPSQDAPGILYPNSYILSLLEEINAVFDPSSGYIDPNSKRSIEDIEGVLNRLFKNKAEIRDFLLINKFGDALHDTEFSIKDWLSFIFDKITDPTLELGNDRVSQLLKEALNNLNQYKTESGSYENPFDTGKIWFSETGVVSELEHGKFVFEVIKRLFGHVSLMYLFLHSIDFYESTSGFRLDFCTISPSSERIEALVKQYNIQASSQESRYGALQRGGILNHIFSLLFGNSFMHLPTKTGALTQDNRVYFDYSPMPFLSDHLYASSLQDLNSLVQNYFQIGYTEYISKKNIETVYTESCENMLEVFKVKLWDTIAARHLGIAETNALYEQALIQAKYDIFRTSIESHGTFSIRYQVENLLIGYQYSHSRYVYSENCYQRGIVFHNLKVQKVDRFGKVILDQNGNPIMEPLIVFLNKDDFKGKNIQIFRKASKKYDLYNTLEQNFHTSTLDRLYTVVQMILENNGKARFFTAINRGSQYGHQYINIVPGQTFQHLRSYYDINLDLDENGRINPTEANQKELEKIEFLIALSGSYIMYSGNVKSSILLIMKEQGASISDNSICGINHNNIFRIRNIYSQYGAPDGDGYILQQIYGSLSTTGNYYIGPNNNIDPNNIWNRFSNFQPVSQTTFLNYYDPAIWD
ncbi:MAG: hypothetical protein ACFFDF_09615 [Candidatus Odinarchaeota archaeon]